MAKSIPDDYPVLIPYLIVAGASKAIEFYESVFNAKQRMRMDGPNDKVGHAELKFGDSVLMIADEAPQMGFRSPTAIGGSPVTLHLFVTDVDDVFKRAIAAGAKSLHPVTDQFYGDRSGTLEDPFGHVWNVSTHKEDLSPDELRRRSESVMRKAQTKKP